MTAADLARVLLRASLIAVPTSCWLDDDGGVAELFASRADYGTMIDRCIADDTACAALCDAVLNDELGSVADGGTKEVEDCETVELRPDGLLLEIAWRPYEDDTGCAGRRPRGFIPTPKRALGAGTDTGQWLARIATLEAASVTAFAHLVRTLVRLRAPSDLVAAARRAIGDELAHARIVARLAARRGARVVAPTIAVTPEPTLAELAAHNAVEGQVSETLGALIATCQARSAADADVRRAFHGIARDETRHAALSHALAAWLDPQLSREQRAAVRSARNAAIEGIRCELDLSAGDREALGVPAPERLRAAATTAFAAFA